MGWKLKWKFSFIISRGMRCSMNCRLIQWGVPYWSWGEIQLQLLYIYFQCVCGLMPGTGHKSPPIGLPRSRPCPWCCLPGRDPWEWGIIWLLTLVTDISSVSWKKYKMYFRFRFTKGFYSVILEPVEKKSMKNIFCPGFQLGDHLLISWRLLDEKIYA